MAKPGPTPTNLDKKPSEAADKAKRQIISQTDIPAHTLEDALRVPKAIFENYGGKPTKPLDVAKAMDLTPASTQFKMITGAAIAFGLTEGASRSETISLTPLAKKFLPHWRKALTLTQR